MKRLNKILSFILVLSLLFSSLVFTTSAAEEKSSNNIGDYVDESIETFSPNATYTELNDSSARTQLLALLAKDAKSTNIQAVQFTESSDEIKTYLIESDEADDYIMFVPTEELANKGSMDPKTTSGDSTHMYFQTNPGDSITYNASSPNYVIFECDVATEQDVLPFYFEFIIRSSSGAYWGKQWHPYYLGTNEDYALNNNVLYLNMEAGYFHHLTMIGDLDNNRTYIYLDNNLVSIMLNSVMSTSGHSNYKNGQTVSFAQTRVSMSSSVPNIADGMSLCIKNIYNTTLAGGTNGTAGNLGDVLGTENIEDWNENRYTSSQATDYLVPLVEINGVKYSSTTAASAALNTNELGNEAKLLRSMLTGTITVNCDAVFRTYTEEAKLTAGENVTLTKNSANTWIATLIKTILSASSKNFPISNNLTSYLKYVASNNLISTIMTDISVADKDPQTGEAYADTEKDRSKTVNTDIILSNDGNEYLNIYDNSGSSGDFGKALHFQINANLSQNTCIAGHDYIVFDYDIYSESTYVNFYSGFILRDNESHPLPNVSTFHNDKIKVNPGAWNHVTFIGDVETKDVYVYVNNTLVSTVVDGMYLPNNGATPLDDSEIYLSSFRTMQISGQNISGSNLTTDMSVASDNYCLRFWDGTTYEAGTESIAGISENIYDSSYDLPSVPVIARVEGSYYFDVNSINEALASNGYTTTHQNVTFYRNFIGTVSVDSRATIIVDGIDSNIVYSDKVNAQTTTNANGHTVVEVYYNKTVDTDASTEEWTEDVISTFPNQQFSSADNASILAAIKSGVSNNKYASHSMSGSGTSQLVEQLVLIESNGIYSANYGAPYLLTSGQMHTIGTSGITVTPTYTAEANIATNSSWSSNSTTVNSFNSTEVQYYLITEFDLSNVTVGTNNSTLSASLTVGGSAKTITLISNLAGLLTNAGVSNNSFAHVTIIGEVDVTPTTTVTRSESGSFISKTYSYAYSITNYSYSVTYKIYVNNTLVETVASQSLTSTTSQSTVVWNGMSINVANGNEASIDNVYMNYGSETITTSLSQVKMNTSSNATTNATNLSTTVANNANTSETNTTTIDDIFVTSTINDSTYGKTSNYEMPAEIVTGNSESVKVGEETKTEEIPAVNTPIAIVNGTAYYADDEAELREILANANGDTDVLEVTILRTPTTAYEIGANAIVDTNNLGSNVVTYDESKQYQFVTNGSVTTVVVIGATVTLANLNGVNYYDIEALKTAIKLADEINLNVYTDLGEAIDIVSPAVIITNGIAVDYNVDEYEFIVTESNGTVTIVPQTATPTIRLIIDGVEAINDQVTYGTDIADYLTASGIVSAAIAHEGKIFTNITYTSETAGGTSGAYLIDGKPTGRITESVTFTATSGDEWENPYIVVNTDGSIANITDYNATNLLEAMGKSTTAAVMLAEDLVIDPATSTTLPSSGELSFCLNGYTLTYPGGAGSTHVFTLPTSTAHVNFYGPGVINTNTMTNTQGLVYAPFGFTGLVTFKDLTINTSHAIGQLRSGNMELINCDINAYVPTTNGGTNVGLTGLFALGEDYVSGGNNVYSTNEMSLIISECDIDFTYYNDSGRYSNYSGASGVPLVYHKIVTTDGAPDPKTTVIIDNSNIKAAGYLVRAEHTINSALAPESSNLKVWVKESTILARGIAQGDIKAKSVVFYEDVKTNVSDLTDVAFAYALIKVKSSDGLAPYYFTSHDYATVYWSDGTKEYWAGGSLPVNSEFKFDNVQIVEKGQTYNFTSTATSAPFSLYANLTLADVIGFNIYIPASQNISKVYLDDKLISAGEKITYVEAAKTECYNYTITFAPQVAAKDFTLLVVLADGTHVSRTISVGLYAKALYNKLPSMTANASTRNKALLSGALNYIEQAAIYNGYNLNMSTISSVLNSVGVTSYNPTTTETDMSAVKSYFSTAQINIKDTCAFRFNAASGVDLRSLELSFVVNGEEKAFTISEDGSYVELSLRAYEMSDTITINVNGSSGTYDLYTYCSALESNADTSSAEACANKQALALVKALYVYAVLANT